ncbi:hypothetical protein NDQ72_06215 [Halomonas sp. KG2]|uniref:hypothetical protein n=1 Tax=Halomonas sp. KG2 TaxID=2951138 RepID=UPI002648C68C|nr:hypothetical protein [Halomonas sp. KG2]WKD29534.1 hypothetical protein NDQ72_06215 [Halomonas sp. KG2]
MDSQKLEINIPEGLFSSEDFEIIQASQQPKVQNFDSSGNHINPEDYEGGGDIPQLTVNIILNFNIETVVVIAAIIYGLKSKHSERLKRKKKDLMLLTKTGKKPLENMSQKEIEQILETDKTVSIIECDDEDKK